MSTPKTRIVSGIEYPALDQNGRPHPDVLYELRLFLEAPKLINDPRYTGQGRYEHSRRISEIFFREFQWHRWSETLDQAACELNDDQNMLCVSGCGTSSKSTTTAGYALKFWMCDPTNTAVIIASKTIQSAKQRIWGEVVWLYGMFSRLMGGYKQAVIGRSPRPYIHPVSDNGKPNDRRGLIVTALHGGDLEKEIEFIKGFHPPRILVIADELDSLEEGGQALVQTFKDNLSTGTVEAEFIGLLNDPSLFNAGGELMAPAPQKPVTLEHKDWISHKGVRCLRFDAWDSPNIPDPKYRGLVRQSDIDAKIKWFGENSPSVWIQLHGISPPEGSQNTVLSEATLVRFHCFESVTWARDFILSASLDPAFGGDACIFRTFKRGKDTNGDFKIAVGKPIHIAIDVTLAEAGQPADYQIAEKVKSLCLDQRIAPDEFSILSWGIGRGVAAILKRTWSPRIIEISEAGAPSDRIISAEHPVPANKEYDRKVTELAFQVREFVEADLIRELDQTTATQLCSRTYEDKGVGGNRKLSIQKKEEMLHSPDEADNLACGLEAISLKGVIPKIDTPIKQQADVDMERFKAEMDFDASEEAYSDPLLDYADLQP